ncbi:MAG: DNA primase [bacterium]|nr:DNA primase [bacterium]
MAEVLAANDIVDVIGSVLELKAAGAGRMKALCPFHQEKTPSFSVNRDRQMYYCFGCGKHGDAISFMTEFEGLSFAEALRTLADRAGIRLPAPTARESANDFLRTRLLELGQFAAKHFQEALVHPEKGKTGRSYLEKRVLSDETIQLFRLGFAAESWDAFSTAARAAGFDESLLTTSGLAKQRDRGGCYDFFRNRLMFPIRDVGGNYVAFGGRDLGGESQAKYINSQENAVYKKSRVLFGLHETRNALRNEKRAILVEGYFDLLRCFDAGIQNVVAPCGTALTQEQAKLLRRYVPEVIVVFDGDVAGVRAALRGIAVLTAAGLSVRALALPEGQDPDDFVRDAGADAFRERLNAAPDFVTFYVRMNEARLTSIEGRTDVARELFGILANLDDVLRRDEYLKRTGEALKLSQYAVRSEFDKSLRRKDMRSPRRDEPQEEPAPKLVKDDAEFVAILLSDEVQRGRAREAMDGLTLQPAPLVEVLDRVLDPEGPAVAPEFESPGAASLYAAAANWEGAFTEKAADLVEKRLNRLRSDTLEVERGRVQEAIVQAERSDDTDRLMELLREKTGIEQQIQGMAGTA